MKISEQDLKKLKEVELSILIDFDQLCKEHNIKYFLAYGTLIGAVRHHGFIPWDDDVDVVMLREEYDKFLSVASKYLDQKKYFLQNYKTDAHFYYLYSKIRLNHSTFKEVNNSNEMHNGIFIDLFPLDTVSESRLAALFVKVVTKIIGYSLYYNRIIKEKSIYRIMNWMNPRFLLSLNEKIIKWFSGKGDELLPYAEVSIGGVLDKTVPKSGYAKQIDGLFEQHVFPIPQDYDTVLKVNYANYMELPEESKRVSTHQIEILRFSDEESEERVVV